MTPITLIESGVSRIASDVGSSRSTYRCPKAFVFLLNVISAATDAGDLLDVYIQDSPDGVTTWNDFVRFTQVIGSGGAKKYVAIVNCEIAPSTAMGAPQDGVMSAGVRAGPICPLIRAKWVITDAGSDNAAFDFGITMNEIR